MSATPGSTKITTTELRKAIAYLNGAAKLYEALPMVSLRSRAHMIRQLTAKLAKRLDNG